MATDRPAGRILWTVAETGDGNPAQAALTLGPLGADQYGLAVPDHDLVVDWRRRNNRHAERQQVAHVRLVTQVALDAEWRDPEVAAPEPSVSLHRWARRLAAGVAAGRNHLADADLEALEAALLLCELTRTKAAG